MSSLASSELTLRRRETVPKGLRRIFLARLQATLAELQGDARPGAVHAIRKQCKQLRALLRLVRSELGEETFQLQNTRFRELARPLAGVRDAEVLVETLDALAGRHPELAHSRFVRLREALVAQREALLAEVLAPGAALDQAASQLQAAQTEFASWTLPHPGWRALREGVERAYRRSRAAMSRSASDPGDAMLHSWRKEAKVLRAQLVALGPRWPRDLAASVDDLETLTELLGQDHDLTVLRDAACAQFARALDASETELLLAMIAHRRSLLQRKAFRRGRRCLTRRPRAFVETIHARWSAWHDA
jgi:CHAD domain-containing protein